MNGDLRVESSTNGPKKGSSFVLTLPYKPCHAQAQKQLSDDTSNEHNQRIKHDIPDPGKKMVLVAEDDPVSRKMVQRMIKMCGYKAIAACNGVEAVRLYERHRDTVGLILMDVHMPEMDGLTATRNIRSQEAAFVRQEGGQGNAAHNVPIIALSASAMRGDQERGLQIGMSDYLTKPVDLRLLAATLSKYLDRGEMKTPSRRTVSA